VLDELPQGTIIDDRYQIISSLGRGAWSRVYLARVLDAVGSFVAIKELTTHNLSPEDAESAAQSFLHEAQILTSLDHPGLPAVADYFCVETSYYLIMEWIAGQTLLTVLEERDAPMPVDEVCDYGIELCSILTYLHTHKPLPIVVGDLKPGNIMRTFDEHLKVVDFGVARHVSRSVRDAGYSFVTPGFSPPEQYESLRLDARSDLYALGATLYYLLTRQPLDKFRFQIPPLRRFLPQAPLELEDTLARCLQPQAGARPPDAIWVRQRLKQVAASWQRGGPGTSASTKNLLASLYQKKQSKPIP
jgi:serine/threonine protein kinase